MTSRRPYWCPKTMKRRPCWCPKPVPWELNSFLMRTLSFVTIDLHIFCPRELKHYISSGENLLKNQLDSCCVIMSLILVTTLFYKAVILHGEIWCWSLVGLKGLKSTSERKWRRRAGSFRQISKIIVLLNKVFSSGFSSGPGCSKLG